MAKKFKKWVEDQAKLSLLPVLMTEWLIGLRIAENPLNQLHSLSSTIYIAIKWGLYIYLVLKVPRDMDCDFGATTLLDSAIDFTVSYGNAISAIFCVAFGCYYSQV